MAFLVVIPFLMLMMLAPVHTVAVHSVYHRLFDGVEELQLCARFVEQPLDHFGNNLNNPMWQQRYFINEEYFELNESRNPVVLFVLGGEGELSPSMIKGQHFYVETQAQQMGALLVAIEHRFYGKSVPYNDSSIQMLQYLNVQQALADAAHLKKVIDQHYNLTRAFWVAVGGSYSGALAAWLRKEYPFHFAGALASSAPLLAKTTFNYFDVVANALGQQCSMWVHNVTQSIQSLMHTDPKYIQRVFNTCSIISTAPLEMANFWSVLSGPIAETVQYNLDNISSRPNVSRMCDRLMNRNMHAVVYDSVETFAKFVLENNTGCLNISYQSSLEHLAQTSADRSWTWQVCTTFGFFQTFSNSAQPFPIDAINLDYYLAQCEDVFGIVEPSVNQTNELWGGLQIFPSVSNIVYSNGALDPWHLLGESVSASLPSTAVAFMQDTAHCADLYAARPDELAELVATRQLQTAYIKNGYCSLQMNMFSPLGSVAKSLKLNLLFFLSPCSYNN